MARAVRSDIYVHRFLQSASFTYSSVAHICIHLRSHCVTTFQHAEMGRIFCAEPTNISHDRSNIETIIKRTQRGIEERQKEINIFRWITHVMWYV